MLIDVARRLVTGVFAIAVCGLVSAPALDVRVVQAAGAERSSSSAVAAAAGTYEVLQRDGSGRPDQWMACAPIDYRINPRDEPAGLSAVVRSTMSSIGAQLGVRFRYAGSTTHTFGATTHAGTPTIYLGFTAARSAAGVTFGWPGTIGLGGPVAEWRSTSTGSSEQITYGRVLLSTRFAGARYGPGQTWQALITHEVGHALNLAHRASATSVMHPSLTADSPARFSAAEVAALKPVLRTSGCSTAG
jgi:hypothetical protein